MKESEASQELEQQLDRLSALASIGVINTETAQTETLQTEKRKIKEVTLPNPFRVKKKENAFWRDLLLTVQETLIRFLLSLVWNDADERHDYLRKHIQAVVCNNGDAVG